MKTSKRDYQLSFLHLTKSLVNDDIALDNYKLLLHQLMENYRKDYKNG